jgi:hypothetical protein
MTGIRNAHGGVRTKRDEAPTKLGKLCEILSRVDALPRLDSRTEDEILGYVEDD